MKKIILFAIIVGVVLYGCNSSYFAGETPGKPFLLAHRGLGQTFSMKGIDAKTNTATRIYKPEHPFLENTIASMQAAFDYHADIVELDIQLTKDKQFAVFHDRKLEYRTNISGLVSQYTMEELRQVDIGYGYTADSDKTFPFRGKRIGMMSTLDEVLKRFPSKEFLIHMKNDEAETGIALADYLEKKSAKQLALLTVYGGDIPVAEVKERLPQLRVTSKEIMKKALKAYEAIGWLGVLPASIKHTELHLPIKYTSFIWGWPDRFLKRMHNADTRVILIRGDGDYSVGFDEVEDLNELPSGYTAGIWTNRIDRIGPVVKEINKKL